MRRAVEEGRCSEVPGQLRQVDERIDDLPPSTDDQLVNNLRDGADRLLSVSREECDATPTETTTTETETDTTETSPTETEPTETSTAPEQTTTSGTPTATTGEQTAPQPPPPPEPTPDPAPVPPPPPAGTPGGGVQPEIP